MSRFDYLVEKVKKTEFTSKPFQHLYIEDLFNAEDFNAIITSPEVAIPEAKNDQDLFDKLFAHNYKVISFPGCIENEKTYMQWHKHRRPDEVASKTNSACEGFGVTLRLAQTKTPIMQELKAFIEGEAFNRAIADKFGVAYEDTVIDGGIQKYLDGYEISPHPDIRKKALTFMVNINPSQHSQDNEHHTHYLHFDDAHRYVQSYWEGNQTVDRCWVPWSWCHTVKQQRHNNSMVIFAPSDDTLHGVKAVYNHLPYQRTQLYGNLWYRQSPAQTLLAWEAFQMTPKTPQAKKNVASYIPTSIKNRAKKMLNKESRYHKRNHI